MAVTGNWMTVPQLLDAIKITTIQRPFKKDSPKDIIKSLESRNKKSKFEM